MQEFQEKVFQAIKKIPKGKITTYSAIARFLGKPDAARAVGNACNANPFAPRVPCHRVVKSSGGIWGYAFGVKRKIALLKKEGIAVKRGIIVGFEKKLFSFK